MSKVTLVAKITGMHCAACSSRIEKVLSMAEGVETCSVNLATEKAQVVYDPTQVSVSDIQETVAGLGFGAEPVLPEQQDVELASSAEERIEAIRSRLVPTFLLALAIMFISMSPMFGFELPHVIHPHYSPLGHGLVQFFLVLPVLYLGRNFYLSGIPALIRKVPNMDSLIAIGTGAAFTYSTWNLIEIALGREPVTKAHDLYFEAAAMLIALVSLGKFLEARSKAKTGEAIQQLLQLTPDMAIIIEDGVEKQIPVEEIEVGDHIVVRPGQRIAVDGFVVEGESSVDESMLTGESMPVFKKDGDTLYGGTLNKNGALTMQTQKIGRDTVLSRIVSLVQQAQGTKPPIANLADTISLYFVPVVIAIACGAGLGWLLLGGAEFSFALKVFIAVLVIACPCAMGLATPTSIMVGTGRGAQLGVLVKSGEVLQRGEKVDCVVFDKTGTLTEGRPKITDIVPYSSNTDEELLFFAAGVESKSEHPLALAIMEAAGEKGIKVSSPDSFVVHPGRGVTGWISHISDETKKVSVLLGNKSFMKGEGVEVLHLVEQKEQALSSDGKTVLFLAVDGELAGILAIADPIRQEARKEVERLRAMGIDLVMLTGDNEKTAAAVARQVNIERVIAGILPAEKENEVKRLQEKGKKVAMVGDGINDAPALARADVGIGMGSGVDVAIESADIVLMHGHLSGVTTALGLSRATMKNIKQNLFWAFFYNTVSIPVAAGVLAIWGGPTLNPMLGGAAMALSSVSVVSNALRLRLYRP